MSSCIVRMKETSRGSVSSCIVRMKETSRGSVSSFIIAKQNECTGWETSQLQEIGLINIHIVMNERRQKHEVDSILVISFLFTVLGDYNGNTFTYILRLTVSKFQFYYWGFDFSPWIVLSDHYTNTPPMFRLTNIN